MTSTPDRPRAIRTAPAERARKIAVSARELAQEQGLSALTLRAVASKAGVAPALVMHYVSSMESLIAETFSTIVEAEISELKELISPLPTPRQQLAALLATLLDGTRDDVTNVWVESWSLGRRNTTLGSAVREQMDAWQTVFEGIIDAGVSDGDFITANPAAVAWQLLGMIDGLNAQALVRQSDSVERGLLIGNVAEGMLGIERGSLTAPTI